jgi:hypothetical protein
VNRENGTRLDRFARSTRDLLNTYFLKSHWQIMGALEDLNGMMLFGVTIALLLTMIPNIWPLGSRLLGRRD